ncbi:Plant intracellular Ras-group-related LRR protein 6 [Morella rubra]|uniref:Plant intracellular Ras-group-related LRR protein 6 n=1 Tax=Morella rubra TaxID=262757 RepID=A0A6A1UVF8_9ROSI|nr:Plant intracellular Ras-group-related LRR protein 6 [Morella rubra]
MMYEQQRRQQHTRKRMERSKSIEEERSEIVDLSGRSLESLPSPSLNLGTISRLDLSNNNLQSIPESSIARLLNLVELDMQSNQLKSLPNSIGCLSKLKVLNVSGNMIESLPKTIENCRVTNVGIIIKVYLKSDGYPVNVAPVTRMPRKRSLEELNANFNKLMKLPDTIGFELINLKKMSVNSNKLVLLPSSTSHLTSLLVLDARLNCLRSLPEDLENLINLEVLNVSQNFQYLDTLPYSIGLLINLVELDVSYNKLSTLPDSMGCLKKLQKLSVEGNPLTSPPMDVVEQGLQAMREYLSQKMNAGHKSPKRAKKSWVGKLVRYGTFSGYTRHTGPRRRAAAVHDVRVSVHRRPCFAEVYGDVLTSSSLLTPY